MIKRKRTLKAGRVLQVGRKQVGEKHQHERIYSSRVLEASEVFILDAITDIE